MSDYYTLLTNAGIAHENACKAAGVPIKLTQISVGDGNGAVYNPAATATALKREVWRGPLNALFQDDKNPSWLLAEVTIPPEVGGFYVREAGIWTDTGILYAIVKYPESLKPVLATSGSGKEFYIRAIFETSNASQVTLMIDDTIVKATRAWVIGYVADELAKLDGKQSVRAATTADISLSGAQQIDGVAVVAGDRVLVANQSAAKDNGVYVVANGVWGRAVDADSGLEVTPGLFVGVEVGAVNGDSVWQLVTDAPIVLGVTPLVFEMMVGRTGVSAGAYRFVTVDKYGRVIGGTNPTTLAGSGINDAYTKDQTNQLLEQRVAADSILAAGVVNGDPGLPYFRFKKPDGSAGHIVNLSLSSHGHTFSSLSDKPTTRDGYDLRDVMTAAETRQRYVANGAGNLLSLAWGNEGLTAKVDAVELGHLWYSTNFNPADKADKDNTYTIGQADVRLSQRVVSDWISHAGLISDNPDLPYFMQTSTGAILQLARRVHRHAFSDLDGLPPTAVGHGIYDVYSVTQSDVRFNQKLTRDAISVAGLWGGDINLPYFRRAVDEQPVYFITQATLPKNTCQKGIPGWWKCADTGLLRQRVSIYIGDVSTAWAGAVTWPVAFAEQADSVKLSFLHTNGSPATVSCAYADLTRTGCNLRVDEWGLNPQYGLTLIVEAEGY